MPCAYMRLPDGSVAHVRYSGKRWPACRVCGFVANLACDFPIGDSKTCDASLCAAHATEVAPDVHLCHIHRVQWEHRRDAGDDPLGLAGGVPTNKDLFD